MLFPTLYDWFSSFAFACDSNYLSFHLEATVKLYTYDYVSDFDSVLMKTS